MSFGNSSFDFIVHIWPFVSLNTTLGQIVVYAINVDTCCKFIFYKLTMVNHWIEMIAIKWNKIHWNLYQKHVVFNDVKVCHELSVS